MLNILTLKVGDKYGPEYVNKLYKNIKKNTSVDFDFYCYTEDSSELHSDIKIINLKERPDVIKQWYKIDFHNMPQFLGQKCLILDIDLLINSNLDELLGFDLPANHFGVFEIWWNWGYCKYNGGFQMFHQGDTKHLYDKFYENPQYWQEYYIKIGKAEPPVNGEQNFICEHLKIPVHSFPKIWYVKYANRTLERIKNIWRTEICPNTEFIEKENLNKKIKIAHFANSDNYLHLQIKNKIVKENW